MGHGEYIRILTAGRQEHAIDCGDRTVIHLAASAGAPAQVRRVLLSQFTQGAKRVEVVRPAYSVYPPRMVVARAFSRLSDPAADAMFPTSEHFVAWCLSGQAPRPRAGAAATARAPAAAAAASHAGALQEIRRAVARAVSAVGAVERKAVAAGEKAALAVAATEKKVARAVVRGEKKVAKALATTGKKVAATLARGPGKAKAVKGTPARAAKPSGRKVERATPRARKAAAKAGKRAGPSKKRLAARKKR